MLHIVGNLKNDLYIAKCILINQLTALDYSMLSWLNKSFILSLNTGGLL